MSNSLSGLGLRSLFKNFSGTLGRQLIAGLLQLITVVIIARAFGPEGNGAYAVALLMPSILVSFLNLGVGPANIYFLGSSQFSPYGVLTHSIKISLVLSLVGILIGALCIHFKADEYFPGVPYFMLWLALFSFPLGLLQSFISSIFQGMQKFREYNIVLLTQPVLTLFIVSILVMMKIDNFSYLIVAPFIAVLFSLVLSGVLLNKYIEKNIENKNENYLGKVINYGCKAHISNILAFLNYKVDIFLVNLLISPAAAGIYVVAVQLSERLWMLSQAISTVLLPRLSELMNDEEKRLKITPFISRVMLLSTSLLSIVFILLSYPLIYYVFGVNYISSILPLLILVPGMVITSASRVLANDLAARGRPELNMYTSIFVVACNIVGNIILIPLYGIVGAAVATTIAYSLNFALRIIVYRYITNVPVCDILFFKKNDLNSILASVKK